LARIGNPAVGPGLGRDGLAAGGQFDQRAVGALPDAQVKPFDRGIPSRRRQCE
jgi:hypothetical protein